MFEEPREGSMARFVKGDAVLFVCGHNLGFLFQTTDDSVNGIQEILLAYGCLLMTGCNQGRFITYIGDVCATESRCLASQNIRVNCIV